MGTFVIGIHKQRAGNDMIRRRTITTENDVFHTCQTGQCLHIRIVRLKSHRVGKEEKIIDLSIHNTRSHLLVTSQRTGFQNCEVPLHFRMLLLQCFQNQSTCSTCTIEFISHQQFRVPQHPFDEVFFHCIMRYQPDASSNL